MVVTNFVNAQSSAEKAIIETFNEVTKSFNSGNDEHGWSYYTDNAFEISPDGSIITGKKPLRENWSTFMKMTDTKPTFKYTNPSVRIITSDVATITFDSEADIKIQGQQVGGKTKGFAVLHKINGKWMVEGDAIVPVTPMPDMTASNDNEAKAVFDKAMKAFNAQNVTDLVALFSETATHITPTGAIVKGKAALTQNYIALFKMFEKMPKSNNVKTEYSDWSTVNLTPDLILTSYREKTTTTIGAKTQVDEMAYSVLLSKKTGQWLIENLTMTPQVDFQALQASRN